jgi:hypothetical protein
VHVVAEAAAFVLLLISTWCLGEGVDVLITDGLSLCKVVGVCCEKESGVGFCSPNAIADLWELDRILGVGK